MAGAPESSGFSNPSRRLPNLSRNNSTRCGRSLWTFHRSSPWPVMRHSAPGCSLRRFRPSGSTARITGVITWPSATLTACQCVAPSTRMCAYTLRKQGRCLQDQHEFLPAERPPRSCEMEAGERYGPATRRRHGALRHRGQRRRCTRQSGPCEGRCRRLGCRCIRHLVSARCAETGCVGRYVVPVRLVLEPRRRGPVADNQVSRSRTRGIGRGRLRGARCVQLGGRVAGATDLYRLQRERY